MWTGRVLSALVVIFLLADGLTGLLRPATLVPEMAATGYAASSLLPISLLAIVCAALYTLPATRMLGAILITGFLGGAIATHVRVSAGVVPPEIICAVVGLAAWAGLWLRDTRIRELLPVSS